MAEDGGVEPHPISENLVFKASRGTNPTALLSNLVEEDGFEPTSLLRTDLQSAAPHLLRRSSNLVPPAGIEPT